MLKYQTADLFWRFSADLPPTYRRLPLTSPLTSHTPTGYIRGRMAPGYPEGMTP